MALLSEQIREFKKELRDSLRPLFFFDDDPDGVCSFLLFYRFIKDGKGIIIKQSEVTGDFVRKI